MDDRAADLFDTTLAWTRQWWDPDVAMLWNPDGAFVELARGRTLHQVPNTAWFAWALLATGDSTDERDARAALEALVALQYDAPGTPYHGTFRRFLEFPAEPPADPVMWEDYDPNWRQFVGTTFALILEDHGARLGDELGARVFAAVDLASAGEPDGRIPRSYTNPALMRAWLDAWVGRHRSDHDRFARGERFAEAIVDRFDRLGTFDEFNSATYAGIDLYALALWRTFPPSEVFDREGRRLEVALWDELLRMYHPGLGNWCGPYTRCYHPDARRSVAKAALWMWALLGRDHAPIAPLDADVDHGHDLASGPVVARLAAPVEGVSVADLQSRHLPRRAAITIGDRSVVARLDQDQMIGVESSPHDWGGWGQFMPVVAHWAAPAGVEVLWLAEPHQVTAATTDAGFDVRVSGTDRIAFWLQATSARVEADGLIVTEARAIRVAGGPPVTCEQAEADRWRIELPAGTTAAGVDLIRF